MSPWAAIAVMAGVTLMLRAAPLLMRRSLLRAPWMVRLNQDLPLCVMVVLVLHSLAAPDAGAPLLAELLALGAVGATYLLWRNALVSVSAGLAALALLASALV